MYETRVADPAICMPDWIVPKEFCFSAVFVNIFVETGLFVLKLDVKFVSP